MSDDVELLLPASDVQLLQRTATCNIRVVDYGSGSANDSGGGKQRRRRRKFVKQVWYRQPGEKYAVGYDRAPSDAQPITLKADARVLNISNQALRKYASAELEQLVVTQSEKIDALIALVEKLLGKSLYDAIQTDDRLIIINEAALIADATSKPRRRWAAASPTVELLATRHQAVQLLARSDSDTQLIQRLQADRYVWQQLAAQYPQLGKLWEPFQQSRQTYSDAEAIVDQLGTQVIRSII
jgi:hypothetical protein